MNAPVFVTGGSGLVGRAIVARLLAEGRYVRALARSDRSATTLRDLGAEPVMGDVLDRTSLEGGMGGCETVFHAAGMNAFCLVDPRALYRVNVDGSRNVVTAASAAGVRRVVYTSSASTIGEEAGTVGTEDAVHRGWFLSDYERSKHEAEQGVLAEARRLGVDVVSLNPASVQGPGRTGGTARLLLAYLNGRLPVVVETRVSLVDIADCAEGHVLAESRATSGRRYLLSGGTLTLARALDVIDRIAGARKRPFRVPAAAAMTVAGAVEAVSRLRRRRPPVCREMVRTLVHGHAYDGSRATRELGLRYTAVEETLRRTYVWYLEQGLISR